MTDEKEIWVLGRTHPDADKSFTWTRTIPNIVDADTIIIDLTSITEKIMDSFEGKIISIKHQLEDKLFHNGTLVFILKDVWDLYKNFNSSLIIPLNVSLIDNDGTRIKYDKDHPFNDYLSDVKKFDYYINSTKIFFMIEQYSHIPAYLNSEITDNSGRYLGGIYTLEGSRGNSIGGQVILLPPSSISPRDAITKIISHFKKDNVEKPPAWTEKVSLAGLNEITERISKLEKSKKKIESEIETNLIKKRKLSRYRGLLYAQDKQLEKIVKEAFILLGFKEIKRKRDANYEDWIINLNSIKDFKFGVLEVKGRGGKTKQADIVQCSKWVDDYLLVDPPIKAKGIFISNQFRLKEFPASKDDRNRYEPNELGFAKSRNICIIPSHVLFDAVNRVLNGKKPDRKKIEQLIFQTDGVLANIL